MRMLAQRIERATRPSFLEHQELMRDEGQQSIEDRELILRRINEFRHEGYEFPMAKRLAVEEWLESLLMDNCIKA